MNPELTDLRVLVQAARAPLAELEAAYKDKLRDPSAAEGCTCGWQVLKIAKAVSTRLR